MNYLLHYEFVLIQIYNLGTGKGYSVFDMIKALEKASGKTIAYKECPRRPGDLATLYADATLASKELGWTAKRGLDEMCKKDFVFIIDQIFSLSQAKIYGDGNQIIQMDLDRISYIYHLFYRELGDNQSSPPINIFRHILQ